MVRLLSCGKHSHMYKKPFGAGMLPKDYLSDFNFGMLPLPTKTVYYLK